MDWRDKVSCVSEKVFPGLSQVNPILFGNEIMSNLPLQMSLFFNATFFPVWLLVVIFHLYSHYSYYGYLQIVISFLVFSSISIIELLRLYLGYVGNLQDKISELAAFWLLSLLLQVPLEIILYLNPYFKWHVIEYVVNITMSIMLILQIIIGYFALKNIVSYQTSVFRLLNMKKMQMKRMNSENKND